MNTLRVGARVPPRVRGLQRLVAVAIVLASAGAVFAARMVDGHSGVPRGRGPYALGRSIPTSFGFLTVPYVERIGGLSAQDLAGSNHGVQNLVGPDHQQIQVSVQLTSTQPARTTPYGPSRFRLAVEGRRERVLPQSSTVLTGELQPHAAVGGHLGFVVPRTGTRMWLEFDEGSGREPVLVELGRTARPDRASPDHGDPHRTP